MSAKIRYLKLVERQPQERDSNAAAMPAKQHEDFLRRFVKATTSAIEEGLVRDGSVRIHKFGSFQLQWVNERKGRKPGTSESLVIPGHYRVVFRPYKKLESRINAVFSHLSPVIITPAARTKGQPLAAAAALPIADSAPVESFDISERVDFETVLEDALSGSVVEDEEALQMHFNDQAPEGEPALADATVLEFEKPQVQPEWEAPQDPESEDTAIVVGHLESTNLPAIRPNSALTRHHSPRVRWYDGAMVAMALLLLLVFSTVDQGARSKGEAGETAVATQPVANSASNNDQTDHSNTNAEPVASESSDMVDPATSAPFFAGGTHKVAEGDNLWKLSALYYLDAYLWPNIYRVNTEKIKDPDFLTPAQRLKLPALIGNPAQLTAQDRRDLAEGYFLLFKHYKQTRTHLAPFALWASVKFDRGILDSRADDITEDELAFLSAHNVQTVATR